jgi:hypothetical protein
VKLHSHLERSQRARGRRRSIARNFVVGAMMLLALGMAFGTVRADSYDDRRVRSAARLMRALLAADQDLAARHPEGSRVRVIVLADNPRQAEPLVSLIAPPGDRESSRISGVDMEVTTQLAQPAQDAEPPDAVFLAAPLGDKDFSKLLAWCIARRVILYSPFEGDVERGATAGLSIQAKVQPFVNRRTLDATGITLRSFFLDHSRVWQ